MAPPLPPASRRPQLMPGAGGPVRHESAWRRKPVGPVTPRDPTWSCPECRSHAAPPGSQWPVSGSARGPAWPVSGWGLALRGTRMAPSGPEWPGSACGSPCVALRGLEWNCAWPCVALRGPTSFRVTPLCPAAERVNPGMPGAERGLPPPCAPPPTPAPSLEGEGASRVPGGSNNQRARGRPAPAPQRLMPRAQQPPRRLHPAPSLPPPLSSYRSLSPSSYSSPPSPYSSASRSLAAIHSFVRPRAPFAAAFTKPGVLRDARHHESSVDSLLLLLTTILTITILTIFVVVVTSHRPCFSRRVKPEPAGIIRPLTSLYSGLARRRGRTRAPRLRTETANLIATIATIAARLV
ncbi:unnamed protein product [Lampetra fluviatilis]